MLVKNAIELESGLLALAKTVREEDFDHFLELATLANKKGVLYLYLKFFTRMIAEGNDPSSSFSWAYYDALSELENTNEK